MSHEDLAPVYRFGRFELEPRERRLLAHGEPLTIGPRAFDVLVALAERAGQLVTKDELVARVWPKLIVEENNLQAQVSSLRKILGQEAIETVPGHGYRLASRLERVESVRTRASPRLYNLPQTLTSFVGRENELAEYAQLFGTTRLLTLTGVGGCGKTRIAIKLAEIELPFFADGVWFVDLAPVAAPERVALAVATALRVRERPEIAIEETLAAYCSDRRLLLVLDNCEHLLEACAKLAERLLRATPHVRALVTSREGLGIAGERIVPVHPLTFPRRATPTAQELAGFDAVALFVDRVRQVAPEFTLDDTNAGAVGEICRRLDGIPLALELAAARAKVLSVDQIRARLDDRFRLLTGGPRSLPRHRTLLAALQWSYEHLLPEEQKWLRCLSVFAGGWTLDAATAIGGDSGDDLETLRRLERLVDTSLVLVDRSATGEPRYRLLETVRQYAQDRLNESGESDTVRERHLAYFLALAKQAHANFFTRSGNEWYERLDRELANLLAAHALCARAANGIDLGLELAASLRNYWINRGLFGLGEQVYAEALALGDADPHSLRRGRTLYALGQHRNFGGRFAEAIPAFEEALAILREHHDDEYIAYTLDKLAFARAFTADATRALACSDEELRILEAAGDAHEIATALTTRAAICRMLGDCHAATAALDRAMSLANRDNRDHWHTILTEVVRAAIARGDLERARETLVEAIHLLNDFDSRYRAVLALDVALLLAAACGDWLHAARLQCVFDEALQKMGEFRNPYDDAVLAELRRRPRAALGEERYAAAYQAGRGRSLEDALDESLAWIERGVASAVRSS